MHKCQEFYAKFPPQGSLENILCSAQARDHTQVLVNSKLFWSQLIQQQNDSAEMLRLSPAYHT